MRINNYLLLLLAVTSIACQPKTSTNLVQNDIIPIPVNVEAYGGTFELSQKAQIAISSGNEELLKIGQYLQSKLSPSTGFGLEIAHADITPTNGFYLTLSTEKIDLGDEGYEIQISESQVSIVAYKPAGVFRGVQTIRQLLPGEIEATTEQKIKWTIPTGKIIDYPEYGYRGSMLDVSRHFFGVGDVKRYIDLIAGLKMNVLHLHLTDDQGWRIEIKSWPNLTAHGGKTEIGGGEGGFFTQEQYKDIVQYAADRYILIVPEIDVPSHTFAALTSYPELNCDGQIQKTIVTTGDTLGTDPYTGMEVGFCTLCTDKEIVFQFMNDVIRELSDITPGPYIHMGGDESHVTPLEDYIPFMEKVQGIVLKNNKTMIGWDEVAHAQLDSSSIVQFWDKKENTLKGVAQGVKVLMSPSKAAYMDMKYDSTTRIGLHWAAYIAVDSAYRWDPTMLIEGIGKENILGVEAPLWSETLENMDDIEYLMFPRIMGHAEIGWSASENRNWNEYKVRLGNQAKRLKIMGVDYYPSPKVPWKK